MGSRRTKEGGGGRTHKKKKRQMPFIGNKYGWADICIIYLSLFLFKL